MTETSMHTELREIMADEKLSRDERVSRLETLRREARDRQRAASEADMIPDDGLNDDLHEIELALQRLGVETVSREDGGAATL
ncbi:hypothetical protein GN330_06710 [Nitratireductor sp. CAU 1489]|uniref:Uncharacterized protein n=1 Tax=Nitratireductor arenosus TaxID=2682096 RepID=A0A844QG28_9HYPH|nr:hypothetical protein [Nitratireductor arenosus]MVA96941.1 hypothetical protein [Nitratireductor arenosus]